MAVEFSDEDTGAHIERIGRFSTLLAEHVGMDADFCATLTSCGAAARRGQGRDSRRDPAQAGQADYGGARDRGDPRRGGPPAAARLLLLDPRPGGDDRAQPPREVGRERLPEGGRGRGDPDRGADRGGGGRVRRADERSCVPQGVHRRGSRRDDARAARATLRPGAAGCVHGSARPLRSRRARAGARRPRCADRRASWKPLRRRCSAATPRPPRARSPRRSRTACRRRWCTTR